MKKILLVLVGGTICTELNDKGNLSVSCRAGSLITDNFFRSGSPYIDSVSIETTENLGILSENMTTDRWNIIIETFKKYNNKYDGIIMAHGTDTLAYSAALFSMLLSGTHIPVFVVSAHKPLMSEHTNGNDNFRCAVECICRGITPNIYVPYRNPSDGQMYLHLASRLRQCENYSDDFHSAGELNISGMTEENYGIYFNKIKAMFPSDKVKKVIDTANPIQLKNNVLYLMPYVGIDYSAYNYDGFSAVLHGSYHAGTACVEAEKDYSQNSILHMLDRCLSCGTDVYFSPSVLKQGTYETVSVIGNHTVNGKKINFIYGYTNEMAYAKLVIAYSLFDDDEKRKEFINNEYNFEFII